MAQPQLSSVTIVNSTTIDANFNQVMDQTGVFLETTSYTVAGHTVTAVSAPSTTKARLTLHPEMKTGAGLSLTVSSSLRNPALETMNLLARTRSFTGSGTAPTPASAQATATRKVRVTFSEAMAKNANLLLATNYTIEPTTPGAVKPYVTKVTTGNEANPTYVDLETTEMTNGATYQVGCALATDVVGNPISTAKASFTGVGDTPTVKEVKAISANRVDVKFSERMDDNADLRNPAKYSFNNGLAVVSVAGVADDTVQLVTTEQVPGTLYTLTVTP